MSNIDELRDLAWRAPRFDPPMPPPAPDGIGALGIVARLRRNAFSAFPLRCREQPVLVLRMPGKDVVVASAPESMRGVLATRPELYKRIAAGDRIFGALIGRGVASSEGEAWRRQRRILAPAFTPRTVALLARHMVTCAEAALRPLEASRGLPIDLLEFMQDLSLDVACTSMFSLEIGAFGSRLRDLLTSYADGIGRPRASDFLLPRWMPTPTTFSRSRFRGLNRAGFVGGWLAWNLRRHRGGLKGGVEGCLGFGRRDIADGLEQPAVVVPVDPFERGILDGLERPPWATPVDHLGLEQAVDSFSEGVVVTVPYAAD